MTPGGVRVRYMNDFDEWVSSRATGVELKRGLFLLRGNGAQGWGRPLLRSSNAVAYESTALLEHN